MPGILFSHLHLVNVRLHARPSLCVSSPSDHLQLVFVAAGRDLEIIMRGQKMLPVRQDCLQQLEHSCVSGVEVIVCPLANLVGAKC